MLDAVDAYSIANEISLMRDIYRGTVLLVEGDDDGRLMEKFKVREDRCRIVPAFGKESAIQILRLLRQRGHAKLLLVMLDSDFWRLTGEWPGDDDIVLTDFHDLEMDIAMSGALDDLIRELREQGALASFEEVQKDPFRLAVLREVAKIGIVQYANALKGFYLRFRNIDLSRFVHRDTMEIDVDAYLEAVLEDSDHSTTMAGVLSARNAIKVSDTDLAQVIRGHDFTSFMAIALRYVVAERVEYVGGREHIEMLLRLTFGRQHFEQTALYRAIMDWETRTGGSVLA